MCFGRAVLLILLPFLSVCASQTDVLEFLELGNTNGVTRILLPPADDDHSAPITIPGGFPFWSADEDMVYVGTNGYFSFGVGITTSTPLLYPSGPTFTVAPFWADNDIRQEGEISYEVHSAGSPLISEVNSFIRDHEGVEFTGTWMVIAEWYQVHEYPYSVLFPEDPTNTYQGILITNGDDSYAVFIYQCNTMGWPGSATIGYYASGDFYENHIFSGTDTANSVACLNSPSTVWSNLVYQLHKAPVVSIVTDPTGPVYQAALWIFFRCNVDSQLSVTYDWEGYCMSQGTNQLIFRLTGFSDPGIFTLRIRSTLTEEVGCVAESVVCKVTDEIGSVGEATQQISNITGVGLFGTTEPISNNSAFIADSADQIGVIYCHSASRESNIGRWISPSGNDITSTLTDSFEVAHFSGTLPSYTTLQLVQASSLGTVHQGVYSCVIPDETGAEQTLHIGLYPNTYTGSLSILAIERTSENPLTISCTTNGLPPTIVQWSKGSELLEHGEIYQMSQTVTERSTSTYSSLLSINAPPDMAEGLYRCHITNEQTSTNQSISGPNTTVTSHYFSIYTIGDVGSIRCSLTGATRTEWLYNGEVVASFSGDELLLNIAVNDSIHGGVYTCRGYNSTLSIPDLNIAIIVQVPSSALEVSVLTSSSSNGIESFICIASETVSGLADRSSLEWQDPNGNPVINDGAITLIGPVVETTLTTLTISIALDAVGTSHAGTYTCRGTLISPALSSPLVKAVQANFTVQIPTPTVSITSSGSPLYAGSDFTVTCTIELSESVDTEVMVSATWKMGGTLISGSDRITVSQPQEISSNTYTSELTFSPLSKTLDSGDYSCEVSIHTSPASPYVSASAPASDSVSLTIQVPSLVIAVAPLNVSSLNVEPYNTFSIVCTATTEDTVTALKVLQWERQIVGTDMSIPLVHNGDTVVINSNVNGPTTASNLTITETTIGMYIFVCVASLQVPGDAEIEAVATATTLVKGPMSPITPVNLGATVTNFSMALLEWQVPYVAYTPEQYFAKYGTSNGNLDQMSETILGVPDISAVDQHYSLQLTGLQHDTTYYYQLVAMNSFGTTTSDVGMFTVEEIPLFVSITPQGLAEAGQTYSLTCTVSEEQDIIGTPTVTWLGPDGQPLSSGNDISISSQVLGFTIISVIQFDPVEVPHSGEYTCQAVISEIDFTTSAVHDLRVFVHTLTVSIESTSTEYQAATPVTLTCVVEAGATAPVTYQWSSSCSGDCFVADQMSATVTRSALRSIDSGEHICLVTDSAGNTGVSTTEFTVTGIGLHYSLSGPVANNSIVRANSDGSTGAIQCISGSMQPNVGQWIAPDGQELTHSTNSPFVVTVGGSTNPGYVSTVVANGRSLSNTDQGVYSCILPDENGNQQILHVGIYLSGFSTLVSVTSLERTGDFLPVFAISCTSTGSPATAVTWTKDGELLVSDDVIHMSQLLTDATTTTYNNVLSIDALPNMVVGQYSCTIDNDFGASTQSITFAGLQITGNNILIVGDTTSLICSSDLDVSLIEWLYSGQVVTSSTSQRELELEFSPVSDTIHGREYTCRVTSPYGIQEETISLVAEVLPDDFSVSITASDEDPVAGQQFMLTCMAAIVPGVLNVVAIEWRDSSGSAITSGEDIIIGDVMVANSNVSLALHFNPLRLSHGEEFSCHATITTAAPPFQLTKAAEWDLIVGQPTFEAEIQPPNLISFDVEPYNTFTLYCTATVHDSVIIPKYFQWKQGPEGAEEILSANGGTLVIIHSNTNATTSSSALTVTENTPGSYRFVCTANLQFSEVQDIISVSDSASVLVRGPETPTKPTDIRTTVVTTNSVVIQWKVSTITYTPETYVVLYGLSEAALDQQSVGVMGNRDTSAANELFSVTLTELQLDTTYHYRVIATNTHDSASSDAGVFTTLLEDEGPCTRFFQLLLSDVNECNAWRFDRPEEKIVEITAAISSAVGEQCQCSIDQDHFSNAEFACITTDVNAVLFRVQLTGNGCEQLLSHIEMWVQSGSASFVVMNNRLSIDTNCIFDIESLQETSDCSSVNPSSESSGETQNNTLIIGAAAGGAIGVIIIAIIVVAAIIICTRTLKRQRLNNSQSMDIGPNEAYSTLHGTHIGVMNPYYYDVNSNAYAYPMTSVESTASLPPLVRTSSGDYAKLNPSAQYYSVKDNDSSSGIYEQIHPQACDEEDPAVENPLYASVD